MKRIIIVGATSGIGLEVAKLYRQQGWRVGVAGRRLDLLQAFQKEAPDLVEIQEIDITYSNAPNLLFQLIAKLGGMDIYLHCSGIGSQNRSLDMDIELSTVETNVTGFTRMVDTAFNYFRLQQVEGHIAIISSIAGVKGLGVAPSYSATKRYQNTYIDALAQLCTIENIPVTFTDVQPGFVKTALLKGNRYPLLLTPTQVAFTINKTLEKKKRRIIVDWRYRILVFFWRLIPNCLWERLRIIHT